MSFYLYFIYLQVAVAVYLQECPTHRLRKYLYIFNIYKMLRVLPVIKHCLSITVTGIRRMLSIYKGIVLLILSAFTNTYRPILYTSSGAWSPVFPDKKTFPDEDWETRTQTHNLLVCTDSWMFEFCAFFIQWLHRLLWKWCYVKGKNMQTS